MPARRVFTIGHSTHALEAFAALLERHGVRHVADVRRFPGSRRNPQFAREALADGLAAHGIGYKHIEALGGRRAVVPGSPNDGWDNASFRGYADHMATAAFASGLEALEALAAAEPTAVMCAEALWWHCHRRLVSDALVVRGWAVDHIAPGGDLAAHALTPFAAVDGERVTYPASQLRLA